MKKSNTPDSNATNLKTYCKTHWQVCLMLLLTVSIPMNSGYAQGVYKWTDANGKVHYGDARTAPMNGKKIAGTEAVVEAAPASSVSGDNSKNNKKSNPEGSATAKTLAQAFQGISAERIQKCSGFAKETLLLSFGSKDFAKEIEKQRNLLDQIRANCTGTGFQCTLSRKNPANDHCEPFSWKGTGEMLRADVDGAKVKARPGKF
ncbi:DUF4124 domain-containing protein [Undibacterium amnicola]|uniref:DUF4124 domain-containing protein n=2 Tax=Undibacterium amnicola TaxID=1834038 RepID=A0ABR6XVS0_9BURK|nr:DUF4124 domain-containing protein [Undibacterium amnicola]